MRAGRVAVVAAWQGWCGACADERPLVLTRSGRRTLRSWWAGLGDDHLALTLTCRLCGVGVDVPPNEEDDVDPVEVPVVLRAVEDPVEVTAADSAEDGPAYQPVAADVPTHVVVTEEPVVPVPSLSAVRAVLTARRIAAEQAVSEARSGADADQLQAGRSAVAAALAALVTQQSARTGHVPSEQALRLRPGGFDTLPVAAAG